METGQPNVMELSDHSTESEGTPMEQLGSLNLLELSEHGMYQLHLKDSESDYSSSAGSSKSEKSGSSQGLSFGYQVFESSESGMSPTQSPPRQTMDRVGGFESYDPSRIPSAVFQRNLSLTPLEWSIASNESLFSIHMGNTSFSRDQVLMMGADLGKSESTKADDLFVFNPLSPGVITEGVEFEEKPEKGDTTEYNIKDHVEGLVSENASLKSVLPPARLCSDGSQRSSDSFAFPILADEETLNGSAPVDGIKKHQNAQSTAVSSKSTENSWFSCCSCSSCCKLSCCSCTYPSCCKWSCSYPSCSKLSCSYPSCSKLSCSYPSCCKWNWCSFSCCCKWNWCSFSSCCKWNWCSFSSCCKWNWCSFSSCCKWNWCSFSSCCKWNWCSFNSYHKSNWCSFSCCKWNWCSVSSCCKWNWCSFPSCRKSSWCSVSSCCKWDCCSFSSCCKWDCCSFSPCCKWNCCSRSSCYSWSCSSCCVRRCCHLHRCCHSRGCCHYHPRCCC